MNHFHLELFPPGHPNGHTRLYCWSIKSLGDVQISGTSDDLTDAANMATSALEGVIREASNDPV